MKHRLQRVEEAIKRELGDLITRNLTFGGSLPTIHDVSISPDLKQCHVYMGVLGNARTGEDVIHKLDESRGMLQVALAKRVILKYTPHLHFHLDSSVERGVRILQLIEDLPPIADEEAANLVEAPVAEFETDLPEDEEDDDDALLGTVEDDEELEADEEEDEDDVPSSTAPVRKRKSRPRDKRLPQADD
jgi:ribosome-binding factor A